MPKSESTRYRHGQDKAIHCLLQPDGSGNFSPPPHTHFLPEFLRVAVLACGLSAAVSPALAQPDAGTLLQQHERQQRRLPDRLPETDGAAVRPALKDTGGARVLVKSVRFTGAAGLASEAELQAVVADAIGKERDFAGLEALVRRVTGYLRGRGWFLAEAYLPRQDITDGHIEIVVRAGRLDGRAGPGAPIAIAPGKSARIDPQQLAAIAAGQLPAGAVADERALERALLLMNDLPGVSARARLEPGAEEGSTRVVVVVDEGSLLTASASLDNYGNRDTGAAHANLAVQLNDPFGRGDQLSAAATHADGLDLLRLTYALPLGDDGLRLAVSATTMDYRIVRGTGLTSGLEGESQTAGATLSYPFVRSRSFNLHGALGATHKALIDESAAGRLKDKRVNAWNAGLSGDALDAWGGGGMTSWNAGWTTGRLDLSHLAVDQAADAAGYDSQGHYDKWSYGATRLQKLPDAFTLFASFSGQAAGKNLDSSEKFGSM